MRVVNGTELVAVRRPLLRRRFRLRTLGPGAAFAAGIGSATACLPLASLAAQTIAVQVGDSARLQVAPGAKVGIPLRVDLANAGSTLNLASLEGTLVWGPARLTFDSVRVNTAMGFTQTANTAGAATGSVALSYFSTTRLSASGTLATAWFTASGSTGGTRVTFTATDAGAEDGTRVLSALRLRALDVCVGASGRWGDVNDDGGVSIIDAQQIARSSVGLSVASAAAVAARGDVNAENSVSIIDAQQIARFSVGLSAAARINMLLSAAPAVATVALAPSAAQTLAVGGTVALVATPRDASNADLTGCATVTWSSSAPAVATVSAEGVVTGVGAGSATITATVGGQTATVAVTVQGGVLGLGQTVTGLSSTDGIQLYQVSVPTGTSRLVIRTAGGSGSVRLLLYQGATPAGSAVCESASPRTSTLCAVAAPAAGMWTVRIQENGSAFSNVTLEVNPVIPTLALGQTVTGLASSQGDAVYNINVPAGTSGLTVRTSGGSGSVQLVLYRGATPAGETTCNSYSFSTRTNQLCAVAAPAAGTWTIRVLDDLSAFSNVTLEVNPVIPALVLGQTVTGLSSPQGDLLYHVTVPAGTSGLTVRTSGGSGSVRLLLYRGATPAGETTCNSYSFSTRTNQLCAVAAPAAGTWTIRVLDDLSAFSNVTLEVNPVIPALVLGQTVTGLSSPQGDLLYHVTVPAGTSGLTVRTSGGSGSVRLLLYQGATPAGSAVCTSNSGLSTSQLCAVATPAAGTWTVRVQEYVSSFTNVSLTVSSP